jgi:tRNA 5-methylaminomethyl-2-thiouridine biosynthesis bifunctional protein
LAISGNGFIAPLPDGGYCLGATFQHDDAQWTPRIEDHRENLTRLETLLPGFANGLDATQLSGRVAFRATTPDRLPIFGEIQPGLFAATGLGARGLLWAPLGAELIAARLEGEPMPLERELANAVGPLRFCRNPR